ncbi:MAG: hypothetical protein E5Y52_01500 [Mesorhizobium sp.]|nr:MAG: hypothetical protein E5Y52_01500 [Mesorhizobium sp.]
MARGSTWAWCTSVTFNAPLRKLVLLLHVISSVGFLGAVATFLALAILGLSGDAEAQRSAYMVMPALTWGVIVPLAATTLTVGVVQSLGTPWGLFRSYWVIVKLVLTVIALIVLLIQTSTISQLASAAADGTLAAATGGRFAMVLHAAGGAVVLVIATILSIFKPRGMTRYGVRAVEVESRWLA